jgi:hypothetical protein
MVHEPEAAAIYASRYLKETKGQDFLKVKTPYSHYPMKVRSKGKLGW